MKHRVKLTLAGLSSAVVLTVAACGAAGGGPGDMGQGDNNGGGSGVTETTGMQGMGHTKKGSGGTVPGMLTENGRYSDGRFIDAMVPHHWDAVEMAQVALENAEHAEIKDLAKNIVSTQEAEIRELKNIKRELKSPKVSTRMDVGQMEDMGMMVKPGDLAGREPFDRAFIDAMIPHHRSAIEMAEAAREKSANPRIKELAEDIVRAQRREISQMRSWREEWYPEG